MTICFYKKIIKVSFLVLLISTLWGCSAVKTYPGPRLPREQLAILSRPCPSFDSFDASVDGIEFCFSSIELLPGSHKLTATRDLSGSGYNCQTSQEFDASGYDYCRDERERELSKGKDARYCSTYSYTNTVTYCTVPYTQYICEKSVKLHANESYRFSWGPQGSSGLKMRLTSKNKGDFEDISCKRGREWTSWEKV